MSDPVFDVIAAEALAYIADGDVRALERRDWPADAPMRARVLLSPEGKVTFL